MLLKLVIGFIVFLLLIITIELIRSKYSSNKKSEKDDTSVLAASETHSSTNSGCCGQHEICEKLNLVTSKKKQIEYYDDEELDTYSGKTSDSYADKEIEEFREILYSMQEKDVKGWIYSLQSREIELPDALKDEVFLILNS